MTDFIPYPAWRYHKSGVTAIVYTESDDKQLSADWSGSLPEKFIIPKDATYHGIENVPAELKKSKTLTLPKKRNGNNDRA